jgi:predicted permease
MENQTKDVLRTAEGLSQTGLVSAKRSSNLSRLVGIFFQPKATFESISKNPNWQLPLTLFVILALAATVTMINMIGIGTLMRMSLKDNPRADDIVQMAEESIATKAMFYVPAVVSTPIIILAIAGIFLMIFSMGGKESNFKKVLSVVAHSHFAYALVTSTLFILVVTFRADRGTLDIQNPLAFNLGFFLSHGETSKFLMSLASSLDVLSFWYLSLLTIGFASVFSNLSWRGAAVTVVSLWCVYVLGKSATAAAFGPA